MTSVSSTTNGGAGLDGRLKFRRTGECTDRVSSSGEGARGNSIRLPIVERLSELAMLCRYLEAYTCASVLKEDATVGDAGAEPVAKIIVDRELAIEEDCCVKNRRRLGVSRKGEGEVQEDWLGEDCIRPADGRVRDI